MGLDMYAWSVLNADIPADMQVDPTEELLELWYEDGGMQEIWYWRKHHDLHGWMESLYREKGGKRPDFNLAYVRLTEEDLKRLEDDLLKDKLPPTKGFFFGNNPPNAESIEDDKRFLQRAREELSHGHAVFYSSWW